MKSSPKIVGLFQALGVALYISIFALFANSFQAWVSSYALDPNPVFGIILFLLAFVISALVCSSFALAYPLTLFFGGERGYALKIVSWTAVWLVVFFVVFIALAFWFLSIYRG